MRRTYIICYDLPEGADYEPLIETIKGYGTWAHIALSTWAVKTASTAKEIRDALSEHVPPESRVFVLRSGAEAAWKNVMCRNAWLKEHL